MKILITGGSGLLGRYLWKTSPIDYDLSLTWYSNPLDSEGLDFASYQLNVCSKAKVGYLFSRINPDVVIHCAALGSVDYAEKNYNGVHDVNVGGTKNILWAANDYKAKVIYISSNAVFSGSHPLYREGSPRHPVNAYGIIKKQAEDAVRDYKWDWQIIRPFLLFGWPWTAGRENWASLVHRNLLQKNKMKLVSDTFWQPTFAGDCAEIIWQLLENKNETYHIATKKKMTLYDFSLKVADVFEGDKSLIESIESFDLKTVLAAKRPIDSSYDLSKIKDLGIKIPTVKGGLKQMKWELEEE